MALKTKKKKKKTYSVIVVTKWLLRYIFTKISFVCKTVALKFYFNYFHFNIACCVKTPGILDAILNRLMQYFL